MGNTSSSSSATAAAAAATLAGCSKSTIHAAEDVETESHVLTIDGYSKTRGLGSGKSINSGTFTVGGHSWYIRYYPDGESKVYDKYISVYVYLDQMANNGDVVKARFVLNLLKPNGKPIPRYRKSCQVTNFSIDAGRGTRGIGYRQYISKGDYEFYSHVVKHDVFQIKCDLTVIRENRVETITSRCLTAAPPPDLNRHLADLLESQVGADVTFDVRGERFTAHKAVLAARLSVFMAELFGHMKEKVTSCVQIDDMDPNVFKAMLRFIYTDSLPKIDDGDMLVMAQHLLVAADKYNLERLKLICEDRLCGYIDSKTVVNTLLLAEQHGCGSLQEECVKFLTSRGNFKSILSSHDFDLLMSSCPSVVKELLAKQVAH